MTRAGRCSSLCSLRNHFRILCYRTIAWCPHSHSQKTWQLVTCAARLLADTRRLSDGHSTASRRRRVRYCGRLTLVVRGMGKSNRRRTSRGAAAKSASHNGSAAPAAPTAPAETTPEVEVVISRRAARVNKSFSKIMVGMYAGFCCMYPPRAWSRGSD